MSTLRTPIVLPGQPVTSIPQAPPSATAAALSAEGVFPRGGWMVSSRVGRLNTGGQAVSVSGAGVRFPVPEMGSSVLARIVRVSPRQASCVILAIDGTPCGLTTSSSSSSFRPTAVAAADDGNPDSLFQGVIRAPDVRLTQKDTVKMVECFRPGDIVRAEVISLGDARSYFLSTAANHLGVVYANAASSSNPSGVALLDDGPGRVATDDEAPATNALVPISWDQMLDPVTGAVEKRKVAKPAVAA